MLESIWVNVLSAGVCAALGLLGTWLAARLPNRALWKLSDPARLTVCVAESAAIDTGKYIRKTTGIGQVRALAVIVPSLTRAYGRIDTHHIQLAGEALGPRAEGNLICLGGAKNNARTRDVLAALAEAGFAVPTMDGSTICWPGGEGCVSYEAQAEQGTVLRDYGLVIRAPNPFGTDSTVIVLAGASTYGAVAAARYFVEQCKFRRGWFAAVVSSQVRDDHVCPPEIVRLERLARPAAKP